MAENKTNVMRILERNQVHYTAHQYPHAKGSVSGEEVARLLDMDAAKIFKTLVTQAAQGFYVFIIPVSAELDLKKAARAAGVKSIAMLPQAKLLPLTGYVHGGCSPLGMKKALPTFLDAAAAAQETILVSAGKIGHQIEVAPNDLLRLTGGALADLTR